MAQSIFWRRLLSVALRDGPARPGSVCLLVMGPPRLPHDMWGGCAASQLAGCDWGGRAGWRWQCLPAAAAAVRLWRGGRLLRWPQAPVSCRSPRHPRSGGALGAAERCLLPQTPAGACGAPVVPPNHRRMLAIECAGGEARPHRLLALRPAGPAAVLLFSFITLRGCLLTH